MHVDDVVSKEIPDTRPLLSPFASRRANDLGGAERVEVVGEDNVDLDFGGLTVIVSCELRLQTDLRQRWSGHYWDMFLYPRSFTHNILTKSILP